MKLKINGHPTARVPSSKKEFNFIFKSNSFQVLRYVRESLCQLLVLIRSDKFSE